MLLSIPHGYFLSLFLPLLFAVLTSIFPSSSLFFHIFLPVFCVFFCYSFFHRIIWILFEMKSLFLMSFVVCQCTRLRDIGGWGCSTSGWGCSTADGAAVRADGAAAQRMGRQYGQLVSPPPRLPLCRVRWQVQAGRANTHASLPPPPCLPLTRG
jgi:hypothetical protein